MILNSEDFQFHRAVPFVRIEEYSYNPHDRKKETPSAAQSLVHFNEQGQLLSCLSPATDEKVQCFYREGRLVKRTFEAFEAQEGIKREEQRLYNESGLLIEKQFLQGDHLIQRANYKYNENLELVREENLQNTKIYRYNEHGLCAEEQIQSNDEHIRSLYYHYDEHGNIVELVEESPVGQTCRLHKYKFNSSNLIEQYRLINQDGLVLSNLKYKYNNFVGNDWLERYTWRLSGRAGKISHSHTHSCYRSPCLPEDWDRDGRSKADSLAEFRAQAQADFQNLELREGRYTGQVRIGLMHGIGRLDFFDGSYYFGAFHSGKMEGYGSFYWPDGRLYQGYFAHNKMQGKGRYYLADGSLYQGTFAEGKMLSDQAFYFLEGSSPSSKEKRRALQMQQKAARPSGSGTAKTSLVGHQADYYADQQIDNKVDKEADRAFIEAATLALQERSEKREVSEEQEAEQVSSSAESDLSDLNRLSQKHEQADEQTHEQVHEARREQQFGSSLEEHFENYLAVSEEEITAIQHGIFAGEAAEEMTEEAVAATSSEEEPFAEASLQAESGAEEAALLWDDQSLGSDADGAFSHTSSQSNELLSTLFLSSQESEASPQEPQRLHIQERVPKK